jgi:hypothetical protein
MLVAPDMLAEMLDIRVEEASPRSRIPPPGGRLARRGFLAPASHADAPRRAADTDVILRSMMPATKWHDATTVGLVRALRSEDPARERTTRCL